MEERIKTMLPLLNEYQRRIFLASEAMSYGWGGIQKVSEISGVSMNTIRKGIAEIEGNEDLRRERIRKEGSGRKPLTEKYPRIKEHILAIVDPKTYGNPERVLSYTTLSVRTVRDLLDKVYGERISFRSVCSLLDEMEYSRQGNAKLFQVGTSHPDRNAQFEYINNKVTAFLEEGEPVISIDTKKKEILGNFRNAGTEYRPAKNPRPVYDHDWMIKELGKIAPYGVYNLNNNTGFVNLGISHDTAEFAVESVARWWLTVGQFTYPNASKLLITCDGGGSNGSRLHLWKYQLALLSQYTGLEIHVCHFPPGTSKWNKVEHRLFCYITRSWQGQPLVDIQTAVDLISNTTTAAGLTVICQTDDTVYELGVKVPDDIYASINLTRMDTLGDWNYSIHGFLC